MYLMIGTWVVANNASNRHGAALLRGIVELTTAVLAFAIETGESAELEVNFFLLNRYRSNLTR